MSLCNFPNRASSSPFDVIWYYRFPFLLYIHIYTFYILTFFFS